MRQHFLTRFDGFRAPRLEPASLLSGGRDTAGHDSVDLLKQQPALDVPTCLFLKVVVR